VSLSCCFGCTARCVPSRPPLFFFLLQNLKRAWAKSEDPAPWNCFRRSCFANCTQLPSLLAAHPKVPQQIPKPQGAIPRGSSQEIERSTIERLHGPRLQLQHCIQASRQLLPLPGELPEVNHCLQNCLQLLQHGLHWKYSTTLKQTKDEPTLPRSKTASVEGTKIGLACKPLHQALQTGSQANSEGAPRDANF